MISTIKLMEYYYIDKTKITHLLPYKKMIFASTYWQNVAEDFITYTQHQSTSKITVLIYVAIANFSIFSNIVSKQKVRQSDTNSVNFRSIFTQLVGFQWIHMVKPMVTIVSGDRTHENPFSYGKTFGKTI